jgi:hypothetical protein
MLSIVRTRSNVPAAIRTAGRAAGAAAAAGAPGAAPPPDAPGRAEKVTLPTEVRAKLSVFPLGLRKSIWRELPPKKMPSIARPSLSLTTSACKVKVHNSTDKLTPGISNDFMTLSLYSQTVVSKDVSSSLTPVLPPKRERESGR